MAAADVETMPSPSKYFCHECTQEVTLKLPEFTCSHCNSGFIEELENQQHNDDTRISEDDTSGVGGGGGGLELVGVELGRYMEEWEHLTFDPAAASGPDRNGNRRGGTRLRTHRTLGPSTGPSNLGPSNLGPGNLGPSNLGPHIMFQIGGGPSAISMSTGGAGAPSIDSFIQQVFNNLGVQGLQVMRPGGTAGGPGGVNIGSAFGDYVWGQNGLDNIITQLLNQLENTGPPPADKAKIDGVPIHITTQKDVDENTECAVCQSSYSVGEEVKRLPCTHIFHIPCLDPWLVLHDSCPICRCNLDGDRPNMES